MRKPATASRLREVDTPWQEGVREYIIRDALAQSDALRLVERPMNPQIDPALAVFFFGFGKGSEVAGDERAHVSVVIQRHAVELVRHKGKCDVVALIEVAQDFEKSSTESCVSGRIGRER